MDLESVNCQLCANDNAEAVASLNGFHYVRCRNCGLVYLNPRPSQDYLNILYKQDEAASIDAHKARPQEEELYRFRFSEKVKAINKLQQNKGKLLDIGSAWGYFLKTAKEDGWDTHGVELSRVITQYSQERFNLKVFNGKLSEARFPSGHFDAVTLWHVLEHIPDPISELAEIKRILKKDGLLAIEVPSERILKDDLIQGKFGPENPPWHLIYYNAATLRLLLKKAGFQVIKLKGCGNTGIVTKAESLRPGSIKPFFIANFRYLKYVKLLLQNLMSIFRMSENIIVFARPVCSVNNICKS